MPDIGQQHSIEKSRQLQRNLYLTAKKDKQRRFHALYDRIFRLLARNGIDVDTLGCAQMEALGSLELYY